MEKCARSPLNKREQQLKRDIAAIVKQREKQQSPSTKKKSLTEETTSFDAPTANPNSAKIADVALKKPKNTGNCFDNLNRFASPIISKKFNCNIVPLSEMEKLQQMTTPPSGGGGGVAMQSGKRTPLIAKALRNADFMRKLVAPQKTAKMSFERSPAATDRDVTAIPRILSLTDAMRSADVARKSLAPIAIALSTTTKKRRNLYVFRFFFVIATVRLSRF
jgi:hypothetical protein